MPCLGVQPPGVQLGMLSEFPTLGSWSCVWTRTLLAWVAQVLSQPQVQPPTSTRGQISGGQLSNKCPCGLCVKNCLPLILFPGLAASNCSVCPQLPMESPSVAAGWAELGRVGLRRPHTGTSVRAGSCHVSFGGWWFLTACWSGCVSVCKTRFSASS